MPRVPVFLILLTLLGSCSRNDEYRYIRQLSLIEPAHTLLPKVKARLVRSEFRKNYDQTLADRIGSSFRNFKHIRAYQRVLDDALVYIMLKAELNHLPDALRGKVIQTASALILSKHTGDEFVTGLDRIVTILKTQADPVPALDKLEQRVKT